MKRIAILGSFSGRNKGDLGILRSELTYLKDRATEELTVYIFTKDKIHIQEYLSDIITDAAAKNQMNIKIVQALTSYIGRKTLPILTKCDKVVIGGGGLFFDNRLFDITFSHLLNIFIIVLWLNLLGKEIMIYAVGCSHLDSRLARWMTQFILDRSKIVTVRDKLSFNIFQECSDREIILGADPVFMLEPKCTNMLQKIAESLPKGKKIMLSLLELIFLRKDVPHRKSVLQQFLKQVYEFAEHNGYSILTYTNYTDQKFASRIATLCGKSARPMLEGENHLLPEELLYLISKFDFVISTQLHVGIFSYLAGVPLVSLIYDDKVKELNTRIGNQNYLHLSEMGNCVKVAEALERAASGTLVPRKESVQAESIKLANLLSEFVWS